MRKGWEKRKLEEVCLFRSGTTIPVNLEKPAGDVIYAKVGDMNLPGNEEFITISSRYVDLAQINKNQIIPIGSIIFPKRGGAIATNKKRRIVKPTIVDLNTMALVPKKNIYEGYLYFWFQQTDLSDLSNGTSIPQINNYSFENVFISYPQSLPEQHRIVAILDKAFAAIAKAKENAEKNLANAREVFEDYLQSVFANPDEDWEEKALQDVVDSRCTLSYGIVQPGDEFPNGLPIVRPTDLTTKYVYLGGLKCINPQLADSYKRTTLSGNEMLLCVRGNTGVISISTEKLKGANVTRGIVPISFNSKILSLQFGYYQFISDFINKQIKGKTYGTALLQINIGDLRKITMLIPPVSGQNAIVQKLDSLFSETQKLEAIYKKKLAGLDELKKSLLEKAFNGEI